MAKKVKLLLTDCKRCRIVPEIKKAKRKEPGWIRIECPKCGFALEADAEFIEDRWNSIHKNKIRTVVTNRQLARWDNVIDRMPDQFVMADTVDFGDMTAIN